MWLFCSLLYQCCFIMQSRVEHKVLKYLLEPVHELYEDVRRKALMRLEYEGLHLSDAISRRGGRFFEDPAAFAMERYAYYVCSKCSTVSLFQIYDQCCICLPSCLVMTILMDLNIQLLMGHAPSNGMLSVRVFLLQQIHSYSSRILWRYFCDNVGTNLVTLIC